MNKKVGGAWGFITESFVNALVDKGHTALRYDNNIDTWHNFDADIYIGCSGHRETIPKDTRTKKAIHVNPYGPVKIDGIDESLAAIEWVHAQKPDAVFGYGGPGDRIFWSYWVSKLGIPWAPMPTAGDKILFKDMGLERDVDLIYLGGRWPYKAKTIDKFLLPVYKSLQCRKALKGWGGWPQEFGDTNIADHEVNAYFNRGRVGPCMSEQHTQSYGIDIPERAFKLALCGVMFVHDPVATLKSLIPSAVVVNDPQEYLDVIEYYVKNEDDRYRVAKQQQADVLQNQTYHNRMSTLFEVLGFAEQARLMIE